MQLRDPDTVMRLDRLGSMHPTRLSFLRVMLRRAAREAWRITRTVWDMDAQGFGHALYTVEMPARTVTLVAVSNDLASEHRTDRVIAEAWDAAFVLYDGIPDPAEIARLRRDAPRQEAARFTARDLILSRANKSVRLFDRVARTLAAGQQPDRAMIDDVGYLMRTTAVYGNGKFGIADRDVLATSSAFQGPFQAEMLAVWLIRAFTMDVVEHCARRLAPATAVPLEPSLRRRFGVGNSTGLGMAPFLVKHPLLLHRWMLARETALARVRALQSIDPVAWSTFQHALAAAQSNARHWQTTDTIQAARIEALSIDLDRIAARPPTTTWDELHRWAEATLGLEAQEMLVALLLEPHGALIDDLCETLDADETAAVPIDGTMTVAALDALIDTHCGWAGALELDTPAANARFWYVSADKLEPRLGERATEPGADREQPLGFAHDLAALRTTLAQRPRDAAVAALLLECPRLRHVVRRVQVAAHHPYSEVRDNLLAETMRPIDLLRCKLAMFGAGRFDPRSDRWLRISLFQGAPFPDELAAADPAILGRAA